MDPLLRRPSRSRLVATPGTQHTLRATTGHIETTLTGRINAAMIGAMTLEFVRLGRSDIWMIDASNATSYAPDAIAEGVKLFGAEGPHGLRRIVAIIRSPLVRMGAQVVSASLVAGRSGVSIQIVESRDETFAR